MHYHFLSNLARYLSVGHYITHSFQVCSWLINNSAFTFVYVLLSLHGRLNRKQENSKHNITSKKETLAIVEAALESIQPKIEDKSQFVAR